MSRVTVYRTDVDSPRLARLLGKVPGVAVGGGADVDEEAAPDDATTTPPPADDDAGLREKIPSPDTDEDGASVVKTYGLLGLGVSMVTLGIATVGIWVYRRRQSDDEAETPPPSTGLDTGEPTSAVPEPSTAETELSTAEPETEAAASTPEPSVLTPDADAGDEAEAPSERPGRAEGDRAEVEWTTKDTAPASEADEPEATAEPGEEDAAEPDAEPRPGESIDAAPLLGVAFVAVTGAVVRWLRSGAEEA